MMTSTWFRDFNNNLTSINYIDEGPICHLDVSFTGSQCDT